RIRGGTMQATIATRQIAQLNPALHAPATLAAMLSDSVAHAPWRAALVIGGREMSYRELGQRAVRLATQLQQRVPRGAIAAAPLSNSAECLVCSFAAFIAGMRYTPLNPFYGRSELAMLFATQAPDIIVHNAASAAIAADLATDTGGTALLLVDAGEALEDAHDDPAAAILAACPDLSGQDPALLIFTGGSTGLSKAVEHSHAGLLFSIRAHCTGWELRYDVERVLDVAPLFH